MFISTLDLFKVGIGPSSSHTMGPMMAAYDFLSQLQNFDFNKHQAYKLQCILKGSLAFTGKGHATDKAVLLGLLGYLPEQLADKNIDEIIKNNSDIHQLNINQASVSFEFINDIIFDIKETLAEHPNGLVFQLKDELGNIVLAETYFSVGGGFIHTQKEFNRLANDENSLPKSSYQFGFKNAQEMMDLSHTHKLSIAQMKFENECERISKNELCNGLDHIWESMALSVENGLNINGILPGGLLVERRAKNIHDKLVANPSFYTVNDWLCAYAMAVNEENAAGHMVVTAPTNGAAGVIPAILYYAVNHLSKSKEDIRNFLLTAAAIGGLIKHNSSISGAEVGCQGEVGSASAMAAAGLCAINGGSTEQVENAAEIALEHHLGMTCDPVKGLVQIPCIERNGFGAIKAFTASSLALHGSGSHLMSLDRCIRAMKRTGQEMSYKYKETSLGGLAVSNTEC